MHDEPKGNLVLPPSSTVDSVAPGPQVCDVCQFIVYPRGCAVCQYAKYNMCATALTVVSPSLSDVAVERGLRMSLVYSSDVTVEYCVIQRMETAVGRGVTPHLISVALTAVGVDKNWNANANTYRLTLNFEGMKSRGVQSVVVVRNENTLAQLSSWKALGRVCISYNSMVHSGAAAEQEGLVPYCSP